MRLEPARAESWIASSYGSRSLVRSRSDPNAKLCRLRHSEESGLPSIAIRAAVFLERLTCKAHARDDKRSTF